MFQTCQNGVKINLILAPLNQSVQHIFQRNLGYFWRFILSRYDFVRHIQILTQNQDYNLLEDGWPQLLYTAKKQKQICLFGFWENLWRANLLTVLYEL